jgi:hypothetical protein
MDTKLTLKLNKAVIEKAKTYAASQNRSLSGIVESYLKTLTATESDGSAMFEDDISPFVKNMKTGVQISSTLDEKATYGDYRERKYR